jgi:nucleoside-diphosphate-sugar epimerase
VLLTGSTGFVGSHAGEAFGAAGYPLRVLARSAGRAEALKRQGAEIVLGSLEDRAALAEACRDIDVVVHMAALTHARSDEEYRRVNVDGTRALLDAAIAAGARRFIYLSSLAAVGPCAEVSGGADEAAAPLTAYGRSKLAGELVCVGAAGDIEVVSLRAPAVYGPRDTDLYHFFRIARLGVIPVPTGPARPLQLVHVADLARSLVVAATVPDAAGTYHVAESQVYTWEEVGRLVGAAVDRNVRALRVPGPLIGALASMTERAAAIFGRSVIFNRDKARELLAPGWLCETEAARVRLGFETSIPLAAGLRDTAQWYREQGWL